MYKNGGGGGYLASKNSSIPAQNGGYNCKNKKIFDINLNNAQTRENGKNDNKKRVCAHSSVTKINSNFLRKRGELFVALKSKQMLTAEICLWFLLLCTMVVLTLTPIFCSSKHLPLDAGQTGSGTQYTNSPWSITYRGAALFNSNGVNGAVLYYLLWGVNGTAVWSNYKTENSNTYLSAKNFGKRDSTGYGQLQVKLFNGATLGTINTADNTDLNIDGATTGYWQVVYRSMDSTNDVLTLYMNANYCDAYFDNTSPLYGYYKDSNLREVVQGTYTALKNAYTSLDTYTVLPANIPGQWQSSAYQTGSDKSQSSYTSGASLMYSGASTDAINNGLDDLGTKHSGWTSLSSTTTTPYNNDKLWVPSSYEVLYKDNTTDGATSYVSSYTSADATLTNGTSGGTDSENDGRSGLWELSGYDRASGSWAWLRSGASSSNYSARVIVSDGNYGNFYVANSEGVRVALHLDLKQLVNDTLAKISVGTGTRILPGTVSGPSNLQTIKSDFNYSNYIVTNSTNSIMGARTITFDAVDTSQYRVGLFAVRSGLTNKRITVTGTSGSGTADTLCDYSYKYNNGQLQVTVSKVQRSSLMVSAEYEDISHLNLQINNSALNSLLVLTLLNGDDKIGEYGFVYNLSTQAVSLDLPAGTTIKILATKPFGSRVELLLDGASLAPTGVTSYEITTGTVGTSQTLVVSMIGNNQWSNAIVV